MDSDFTPFRNIINEWYAKDTSKKVRAVFKAKGNAGKHLCTCPPYGYKKDEQDKQKWLADEEANISVPARPTGIKRTSRINRSGSRMKKRRKS